MSSNGNVSKDEAGATVERAFTVHRAGPWLLGAAGASIAAFAVALVIRSQEGHPPGAVGLAWGVLGLSFAVVALISIAARRFLLHFAAAKEGRWPHPGAILIPYCLAAVGWATVAAGTIEFLRGHPEFASGSLWTVALAVGGIGSGCWALVFVALAGLPQHQSAAHSTAK